VDCDADYWLLHLLCRYICRIIFAPVIMKEWLIDLQQYIAEHHTLLARVNSSLFTPKLHFLIHYPRLISLYGPLKHLWCMRFESCHQYFKKIARISNNYRNIALTLSERHQFKKCWIFSGENGLTAEISIKSKQVTVTVNVLPQALQSVLLSSFTIKPEQPVLLVKHVQLDCLLLVENELYVIDVVSEDEIPVFISISHIIEHSGLWVVCGFMYVAQ